MIKLWLAGKMVRRKNGRVFAIEELEKRHFSPHTPGFNNSIYFAGVSDKGISLVTRMSFRSDKHDENWLKIYIPGEGVLGWENLELETGVDFRQGLLEYKCISPGREWKLFYRGMIDTKAPENEIIIDLTWRSVNPILDFNSNGVPFENTARQIAAEKWNPDFFKRLKGLGKVHYEQGGIISGTIEYKGKIHRVELSGIRDHSYGTRNWEEWERHIWLVGILEGERLFNISAIDYDFVKNLKAGFLEVPERNKGTLYQTPAISDIVAKPSLPHTLNFNIRKSQSEAEIPVKVIMQSFFPFMMDGIYHIREAAAEFEIGGIKGVGIAEMGINIKRFPDVLQN